jgi:hypothetical protein
VGISRRIRRTVIQTKYPTTLTSAAINAANHQWKRHASYIPQATPKGVVATRMGLAIRMRLRVGRAECQYRQLVLC